MRNVYVIVKDYEQEICFILALWAGNFLETTPAEAVPPLLAAAATGFLARLAD